MSITLLRRRLVAVLAPMLLFGAASAAAPLDRTASADVLYFSEQFFSDATYTVKVGAANHYCDGDVIWHWGYATAYPKYVYRYNCP
jgi:hypothetical protein